MLDLRAGDTVEVKSREEILATLDSRGTLEHLPFMPEMLKYCGQKHKVYKRADKTCEYINFPSYSIRRMFHTVHLEGLRCDGEYHDGCDATCLLFWKENWLKKIDVRFESLVIDLKEGACSIDESQAANRNGCTVEILLSMTKTQQNPLNLEKNRYSCQATEILKSTTELKWWDIRQYIRDLRSGNLCFKHFLKWTPIAILNWAYQRIFGGRLYPRLNNRLSKREKTPSTILNLQPGEYVKIKTLGEIMQTLDFKLKNRGMLFVKEMVPYCGKTTKVLKIANKIINEANGEMIYLTNKCIILENVVCTGYISDERLFCPRSMYPYWREIWLDRIKNNNIR